MAFTGDELKDTVCNQTSCSGYMTAYEACCACGKTGPEYWSYFKQPTPITMFVNSAINLLCRIPNATGLLTDVDECVFPFAHFPIQTGVTWVEWNRSIPRIEDRCCYSNSTEAVYVSVMGSSESGDKQDFPSVTWSMLLQDIEFDGIDKVK